jgi:rRNA maturation RNase YbeY
LEISINYFSEETPFELSNSQDISSWIKTVILTENKIVGDINVIFCSDNYLYAMNVQHLQHDTLTDIITFNYCESSTISGDIFISIDRVKANSSEYDKPFLNELYRVIIHGILHLIGFDDKSQAEKTIMRSKEDFYLTLH